MKYFAFLLTLVLACCAFGQVYQAGSTYWPFQSNGSSGRTIGLDDSGYVQVVWTKGHAAGGRGVYWNLWNPHTQAFLDTTGMTICYCWSPGYPTLAVSAGGRAYPAWHEFDYTGWVSGGMDYRAREGAFSPTSPAANFEHGTALTVAWPKIALDSDGHVHMVCAENTYGTSRHRLYYSRGIPLFEGDSLGQGILWQDISPAQEVLFDSAFCVGHDIAAAPSAPRLARAWIRPAAANWDTNRTYNADLFYQLSEDNGITWGEAVNLTRFVQPDQNCYDSTGNGTVCNRDTLRAFVDLSLLFDDQNQLHIAFTTISYYHWGYVMDDTSLPHKAIIWHWSETTGAFRPIAVDWIPLPVLGDMQFLPANNAIICRPSLARDESSGYLYCSYLRYDTSACSTAGFLNADVFVSVSTNSGGTWSVGVNVTNTTPAVIPAPPGENLDERDATLADHVFADTLSLFYVLDRDANPSAEVRSLNRMLYRRVACSTIPATPVVPACPLHWDSAGFLATHNAQFIPDPLSLSLSSYPNPFNNTAVLRFELPARMNASVKLFDLLGREVATLESGMLSAGTHEIRWNADSYSSGIYFARLSSAEQTRTLKLMLLK